MEVEATASSIEALIESRARGRDEANRIEAVWAAADRRHKDKQERENREAWADYYRRMARVHSGLASEHAARADAVEGVA